MRITRIFTEQPLQVDAVVELGRDAARHLVTVLRLQVGHPLTLFNGEGGEFDAEIVSAGNKSVAVRVLTHDAVERESPLVTRLGIGLSRGDRFDWVLQKATELGVTELVPLHTERTEVKLRGDREEKKQRHWQQVIVSACEQSGRTRVPQLHPPQSLDEWLAVTADIKLLLHHRSDTTLSSLRQRQPASAALLIGPEGGLSEQEIARGTAAGFQSLTLGPRVFRTETAPVVALGLLQGLWGDFS